MVHTAHTAQPYVTHYGHTRVRVTETQRDRGTEAPRHRITEADRYSVDHGCAQSFHFIQTNLKDDQVNGITGLSDQRII